MRLPTGLAAGLAAAGLACLAGCGGGAPGAPAAVSTPRPTITASSVPAASPAMKAGARAAAARFYRLYEASQFAASWDLLAPAARRQVSRRAWVAVHRACPGSAGGRTRTIRSVTVFGNAAIVTETAGDTGSGTIEDVFNYVDGSWRYSPGDLGIYRHKSVTADVAAAKAAGLCASPKIY
jgi:hypothetical protein